MMSIKSLSNKEFKEKYDRLVKNVWEIQDRIAEIKEFELQWTALFSRLSLQTGLPHPRINIYDHYAYRTYFWDRYQILAIDLMSLINGEIGGEFSVVKQSQFHLSVQSNEFFYNISKAQNTTFLYGPGMAMPSKEEQEAREEEIKVGRAKDLRDGAILSFKRLFGSFSENVGITKEQVLFLKNRLKNLAEELNGVRQAFAHKHEEPIYERHVASLEKLNIGQLDRLAKEFFEIIKDVGLVHHQSGYGDSYQTFESAISGQIDLILFGSVDRAISIFNDGEENSDFFYWEARERFFNSENLKKLCIGFENEG